MLPVKRSFFPTPSRFFEDDWSNLFDWSNREMISNNLSMPAVNIHEDENDYFVELAAPGLDKEKFKIDLDKNLLTISYHSENNTEDEDDARRFVKREYHYSSFKRSFHLNKSIVDDSKIGARYENGVLKIVIPKKEEAKPQPARTIEIS